MLWCSQDASSTPLASARLVRSCDDLLDSSVTLERPSQDGIWTSSIYTIAAYGSNSVAVASHIVRIAKPLYDLAQEPAAVDWE
jgi:hypothetical protein